MLPAAKKQKIEDGATAPETMEETEVDGVNSGAGLKDPVKFLTHDTTLNVVPSASHDILMTLNEGGITHFVAGARANVGVKKGRYLFEAKVVEYVSIAAEGYGNHGYRHGAMFGFSTSRSSLVPGSTLDTFAFDNTGSFVHNKVRSQVGRPFQRDNVVGVLLNLEEGSANSQTVSLFIDGQRASPPQPIPEALKGKTLFPVLGFKNATVHFNFGPAPLVPLAFKCNMLQSATKDDVEVVSQPANTKPQVVFPITLPDEGSFDWLDLFLEKNNTYTELSDRMILDWAEKSGIWRHKGYGSKLSNDKPGMNFQVKELEDSSLRRMIYTIAPFVPRNYVVMEVKGNLVPTERREMIAKYDPKVFKRVAQVAIGKPTVEFTKRTQDLILKNKQMKSDREFKRQQAEKKRKKQIADRVAAAKKKAEEDAAKKKAEAEAAKEAKTEPAAGDAEKTGATEEGKSASQEESADKKGEESAAAEASEAAEGGANEDDAAMQVDDDEDEDPPVVELTEEESKEKFSRTGVSDLTPQLLCSNFGNFSLPDSEDAFDEIQFCWDKKDAADDYIRKWVADKKMSIRVEDLQPSHKSLQKVREFTSAIQTFQAKVRDFHNQASKAAASTSPEGLMKPKGALLKPKQAEGTEEKAAEGDQKEKESASSDAKADGTTEETKEQTAEEKEAEKQAAAKKLEEEKALAVKKKAEEEEAKKALFSSVDIFGVEDICDIGHNIPLFQGFKREDWAMMTLRFEMHHLCQAFRNDVNDPDREGIPLNHLSFYYNKYFSKHLNAQDYGADSLKDLLTLVNDTVYLSSKSILESQLDPELETFAVFVKLTEQARRVRDVMVRSGVESSKLRLRVHDNTNSGGWHKGANNGGNKWDKWGQGNTNYQGNYAGNAAWKKEPTLAPKNKTDSAPSLVRTGAGSYNKASYDSQAKRAAPYGGAWKQNSGSWGNRNYGGRY